MKRKKSREFPQWLVNAYAMHSLRWVRSVTALGIQLKGSGQLRYTIVCDKCGEHVLVGENVHPRYSNWIQEDYLEAAANIRKNRSSSCESQS